MHEIRATARYRAATEATIDLLERLRIEAIYVGHVAHSAWLGSEVASGAIDVLALMSGPQKNQLAMMASNRGYRVEKEELEQSEELDLVPLNFVHPEGDVRVHVLVASNALYGRMFAVSAAAGMGEKTIRIPSAEDFALLLVMGEDVDGFMRVASLSEFNRAAFDERLRSIGIAPQEIG